MLLIDNALHVRMRNNFLQISTYAYSLTALAVQTHTHTHTRAYTNHTLFSQIFDGWVKF